MAGILSLEELPGAGITGPEGWERQGLGALIGHVRKDGRVPADVLDAVGELCETRKPYGHWRLPFDPETIGRAVADALVAGNDDDPTAIRERILSQNALQGALAALRLYYGNYGWGPYTGG